MHHAGPNRTSSISCTADTHPALRGAHVILGRLPEAHVWYTGPESVPVPPSTTMKPGNFSGAAEETEPPSQVAAESDAYAGGGGSTYDGVGVDDERLRLRGGC